MSKNVQQMTATTAAQQGDLIYLVRGGNDYKINVENLIANVGNGGVQEVTYSQLSTLLGGGNLVAGRTYFITDRDIYIRAIAENQLEQWTVWLQRLPDYNNLTGNFIGIWQQSLTPNVGDLVAWNGIMYENTTGANGVLKPNIDTVNWLAIPTNDIRYNIEFAALLYDFVNDIKLRVLDKRGNDVNEYSIGVFKFGHNGTKDNTVVASGALYSLNCISNCIGNHVSSTQVNLDLNKNDFINNNITGDGNYVFDYLGNGSGDFIGNKIFVKQHILMSLPFTGEVLDRDYSSFAATIDITGLSTIDLSNYKWAGEILLTSSNSSETITKITNMPNHRVRFKTAVGLTVTFTSGTIGIADKTINKTSYGVPPYNRLVETAVDGSFIEYLSNGFQPFEVNYGEYT